MDRISTATAYEGAIYNLQQRQTALADSQVQLTSGKRVLHASDDPTAAAQAERARTLVARAESTQRAVEASKNAMTLTESALGDAGGIMQQIREAVVSAGNASYSDAERASVAKQIQTLRDQLLSVANRPDGSGGYVFAGQGTGGQPFNDAPGGVQFTGTGGQVQVASDEPLPLTLDGGSTWLKGNSGNGVFVTQNVNSSGAWIDGGHVADPGALTGSTYQLNFSIDASGNTTYAVLKDGNPTAVTAAPFSSGKSIQVDGMNFSISGKPAGGDQFTLAPATPTLSVFDSIDKVTTALLKPNQTGAQISQAVQTGLRDIDQASSQLQSARSFAGQTLSNIDGVQGRLDATKLSGESTRSAAEDLDMVKALASFQNQQTGYQAALQSYAAVQKLSLMQYVSG